MPANATRKWILGLLAAVLLAKLILVLAVIPYLAERHAGVYRISKFTDGYDLIAINLIDGNGYRLWPDTSLTMMRQPGYVLFLAGVFTLFGRSVTAANVVNILLGLGTAWLTLSVGKRFLRRRAALYVAALFFLLHPGTVLAETRGGVESIFTFLLTALLLLLYRALEENRVRSYFFAGIVLGLSALVKSTPLLLPPALFIYLLLTKHRELGWRRPLLNVVVLTVPVLLLFAPWIARNYAVSQRIVGTSTLLGPIAYQGRYVNDSLGSGKEHRQLLHDAADQLNALAQELDLDVRPGFFQYFRNPQDEVFFNRYLTKVVMTDYLRSPLLLLKNCGLNFIRFWFQGRTTEATYLNLAVTSPLLVLSIWGMILGWKRKLDIGPTVFFVAIFIMAHLPILSVARYHLPLIPSLALLACIPVFREGAHS